MTFRVPSIDPASATTQAAKPTPRSQASLRVSQPSDPLEREADRVADRVMRMTSGTVMRAACGCGDDEVSRAPTGSAGGGALVSRAQVVPTGGGRPLSATTRSWADAAFGRDLSGVRVHTDGAAARSAADIGARAYTLGSDIVFGHGHYQPASRAGKQLLAHELTHVAQAGSVDAVHRDPDPTPPRRPGDAALVERARARLEVLEPLLSTLRLMVSRTMQERIDILSQREGLDARSLDTGPPGGRQRAEEARLAGLNQAPLRIAVGDSSVRFYVNFHVQFEDSAMGDARFAELVGNMRTGIASVWDHRLGGAALGGRSMRVIPRFTRVAATAARDHNFWLIFVRSADLGVVTYPGCALDETNPNVPTSVTDSACDGGVMIVPPSHIARTSILGHETLHLFGLVDRYTSYTSIRPGRQPVVVNDPFRETGGRPDPLGTEEGTILREDLGFLFDRLGVFDQELGRLRSRMATIEIEANRLRQIVRLGRDPNSLMDSVIRRDFNDRLFDSADDI